MSSSLPKLSTKITSPVIRHTRKLVMDANQVNYYPASGTVVEPHILITSCKSTSSKSNERMRFSQHEIKEWKHLDSDQGIAKADSCTPGLWTKRFLNPFGLVIVDWNQEKKSWNKASITNFSGDTHTPSPFNTDIFNDFKEVNKNNLYALIMVGENYGDEWQTTIVPQLERELLNSHIWCYQVCDDPNPHIGCGINKSGLFGEI